MPADEPQKVQGLIRIRQIAVEILWIAERLKDMEFAESSPHPEDSGEQLEKLAKELAGLYADLFGGVPPTGWYASPAKRKVWKLKVRRT